MSGTRHTQRVSKRGLVKMENNEIQRKDILKSASEGKGTLLNIDRIMDKAREDERNKTMNEVLNALQELRLKNRDATSHGYPLIYGIIASIETIKEMKP
jgi:hypothetical protein